MTRDVAADIARRRLRNQYLISTKFRDAASVVRALGAVQAQDYNHAKWAVARRARGLGDAGVERAVATGAILRTHVLRPTWHFVAPDDIRWMLALTAPRVAQAMDYYRRTHRLDRAIQRRSNAAFERALHGGKALTRVELAQELRRVRIDATPARMLHIMMQAELDMVICSGPRRGAQVTYMLFEERVPLSPALDRDEALAELARRFFTTRGPATVQDFSWWSGLTVMDAKRGAEAAAPAVKSELIDGRLYWSGGDRRAGATRPHPVAHLLPNYDEYFIGFRNREAIAARLRRSSVKAVVNGLIGHGAFVDGQLVGRWRRTQRGPRPVTLDLLVPVTSAERRLLDAEVERFGEFLGP